MRRIKKANSTALAVLLVFLILLSGIGVYALDIERVPLRVARITLDRPLCGRDVDTGTPQLNGPLVYPADENTLEIETAAWITACDSKGFTPFSGTIEGEKEYKAYLVLTPASGYFFNDKTEIIVNDETFDGETISRSKNKIIITKTIPADHDWDWGTYTVRPTCQSGGEVLYTCIHDESHTMTVEVGPDQNSHQWGEWTVTRESTAEEEGERTHTCELCGTTESEALPKDALPYTTVYEPITSWSMAATVAWQTNEYTPEAAASAIRPATGIVWLDAGLKVYDRSGGMLAESIEDYVNATAAGMIPAFYIQDRATADALKAWLSTSNLQDCFVIAAPENRALVKDVADLLHVRGMLDFSEVKNPNTKALTNMVASVNDAHGKVIILSKEAATRENIRKLQSLCATVWVKTPTDMKSLMTVYTNGVNGVVVEDYEPAIRAQEFFRDDAPTLLRVPLVIGHRGDPSSYVENTLDSAVGAWKEGADGVENDIQLSADGKLFIMHDDSPQRFLGITGVQDAENLTLNELQSRPFSWDDILGYNQVPQSQARNGSLIGSGSRKEYSVPTLNEYFETFKDTDIIHDTEIKSSNPAILPVLKEMADQYDVWDQLFTITFNIPILDAIYAEYPEISIGALGIASDQIDETMPPYGPLERIAGESGAEAALQQLYGVIDRWNATYNPYFPHYGAEVMKAGRHRGLTVWPWTYHEGHSFVRDYLAGCSGLTVDYPWWTTDWIESVVAENLTLATGEAIPKPWGIDKTGEWIKLETAEPVLIESQYEGGGDLMIWRYKADAVINGTNYGSYYLYSNPFLVKWTQGPVFWEAAE